MIRLAVAALLALSTATAAVADVWTAIPSTSEIRFRVSSLTPTGAAHYQAAGQVTVKGRTRTVRFPVDLRITGDTAQMTGGFSLRRADFGIGTSGPWNALTGREVRVDVTLNARRAP